MRFDEEIGIPATGRITVGIFDELLSATGVVEGSAEARGENPFDTSHLDEGAERISGETGGTKATCDPITAYFREIRVVPLLSREAEVEIGRRLERSRNGIRRTATRCPLIIQELVRIGEEFAAARFR